MSMSKEVEILICSDSIVAPCQWNVRGVVITAALHVGSIDMKGIWYTHANQLSASWGYNK